MSGSPKPDGNTAFALRYALELLKSEGADIKYISLADKNIQPCIGCHKCEKSSICVFNDDMDEIIEALQWCDCLILGSPVYFGMVSAQMKIMMDRTVVLRSDYEREIELSGKVGCGIACGGFRNGGQELTLQCIHTFLLQHNFIVINDGHPFSHSGAAIAGLARDDKVGLLTVKNMTRNIQSVLQKNKAGGC